MLVKHTSPLQERTLSPLVHHYLSGKEELRSFYSFFPDKNGFSKAMASHPFKSLNRNLLVDDLKRQASLVKNTSASSRTNIELLGGENTFSITTGHQLCLFTGPLYFIYKIFSVINLCENLKTEFPDKNFVPVYWMASEDHDFEEVNHLHVFGKKLEWSSKESGAVGEFSTGGLNEVSEQFKQVLGEHPNAEVIIQLFNDAYKHSSLADATRYLVNALFGSYGLVVLDGNSIELKKTFIPVLKKDIFENGPAAKVNESIRELNSLNYETQVNPREINCFYIEKGLRARIEKENGNYSVIGTDKKFTKEQLEKIIETETEKISPNVVLRPVYQQSILPNLAYVGGPGELAYWLEYKSMFDELEVFFPLLVPRNFVTLIDKATQQKIQKSGFKPEDFSGAEQELIKVYLEKNDKNLDLENYKKDLQALFQKLSSEVQAIDPTLKASAEAEGQKSVNAIGHIEQKLNRAIKQKSETELNQIKTVKSKLFPNNVPQERYDNFSMYYLKWGKEFFDALKKELNYNLKEFQQVYLAED
jgi:bacillithiol synthase